MIETWRKSELFRVCLVFNRKYDLLSNFKRILRNSWLKKKYNRYRIDQLSITWQYRLFAYVIDALRDTSLVTWSWHLTENDMNEIVDKLKKYSRKSVHQIAFLLKKHYDEITIENSLLFDREKNIKKEKLKLKINLKKNIEKLSTIIENFNN